MSYLGISISLSGNLIFLHNIAGPTTAIILQPLCRDRPSINSILKKTFIMERVRKLMSAEVRLIFVLLKFYDDVSHLYEQLSGLCWNFSTVHIDFGQLLELRHFV